MVDDVRQLANLTGGVLNVRLTQRQCAAMMIAIVCAPAMSAPARAERIENQVAVFSALDKVTARISKFEVALGQSVTFGSLKVTPRACFSRPTTEQPKTSTFVEVDELQLDGKESRIFTGWMFAESPGLYGVEHPTADVWLTECQKPKTTTAQKAPAQRPPVSRNSGAASGTDTGAGIDAGDQPPAADDAFDGAQPEAVDQEPRRRVRR